ncbi:myoD family inhibitor [Platysternon megacephalum]|uniref:MyoD family inhibitor n=1 Tax=Platysternon megacephalum TaxID=55544 RepID=A0A4D9EEK8_9SAUR|nr:myoD family inhibitor [Platysternon megacephalum]
MQCRCGCRTARYDCWRQSPPQPGLKRLELVAGLSMGRAGAPPLSSRCCLGPWPWAVLGTPPTHLASSSCPADSQGGVLSPMDGDSDAGEGGVTACRGPDPERGCSPASSTGPCSVTHPPNSLGNRPAGASQVLSDQLQRCLRDHCG